jgi:hypothetical protein
VPGHTSFLVVLYPNINISKMSFLIKCILFLSCHDPTCVYVVYTCRCLTEGTNLVHKYINPVQWDSNLDLMDHHKYINPVQWDSNLDLRDHRELTNFLKHFISWCFSLPHVVFMNCSRLHRLYVWSIYMCL